jgi:regulatory protein
MIITAIERKRGRRNRVDVYVDGELRFDVARETAKDRDLRPGRSIEPAEISAIVAADERRSAFDTAGAMLARRPRSEREIRRRLAQRRCDAPIVEETVERLRALGLIDDAAFALAWAESRDRSGPRSRRVVAGELRAHGVDASIARDASATIDEEDAAYRLAQKRAVVLRDADLRAFSERLGGYLQRRGFGWDVVRDTVRRCWAESRAPSP